MTFGRLVGVFADVHGATATMSRALERCRAEGVETIALLGDLFDRHEQADGCAAVLAGWDVVGVYGNHEREVALGAAMGAYELRDETVQLLSMLREDIIVGDVRLTHEIQHWGHDDPLARLFSEGMSSNGRHASARLTFTGHTHFRLARNDRGALDIARGSLTLDPRRRYLINPGALVVGQYAVWNRELNMVYFRQVEEA